MICDNASFLRFRADFFDFDTETGKNVDKYLSPASRTRNHFPQIDSGMANIDGKKRRVLLVEDEEEAKELAVGVLAEYTLICARNFDEGLRAARRGYFDLYILDNWLPDKSGVELCGAIREFDPHTPILFYSAAAYAKDIQESLLAGAQAYIVKPIIPDELRQAVARLISVPPETAFEARRAECAAIREELAVRQTENIERIWRAKKKYLHARVKAIRLRAEMAFLDAGGARGAFAREWLPLFLEELCGPDKSDAASGN
jgi:DNA-binding response OmpR family regulator